MPSNFLQEVRGNAAATEMLPAYKQQRLPLFPFPQDEQSSSETGPITNKSNGLEVADRPFHNWYRFVLSYPPHLVRDYLRDFSLTEQNIVLDPFCGTGTTLIEAKRNLIPAIGLEANPFPHFASCVKANWHISPVTLLDVSEEIAACAYQALEVEGIDDKVLTAAAAPNIKLRTLPPQAERAIIKNSISPLPLHKVLVLLEHLNRFSASPAYHYCLLALGNTIVTHVSNLRFGPEVGVGKIKADCPVIALWKHEVQKMIDDLQQVQGKSYPEVYVYQADARNIGRIIEPHSVDAVITSPPYPNEKDYTRTTRLESVILGFLTDMAELKTYKKRLIRSNTRGVYVRDDDDQWVRHNYHIQVLADSIENRRIALGKTSGFEKLYARVTKLYFGGMTRHLSELTQVLKPGAQLAYVVGDQASYLQVLIKTGELLAEIASSIGYEVQRIDLFRTRFATATHTELREEVVVLRWPG